MADFVLNPETGEVSRQVVSFEPVALDHLQGEVARTEQELADANTRVAQLESDLEAARVEQAAKVAANEEAKSGLSAYHEVAGTQAGVDEGSVDSGSENVDGQEPAGNVDEPVQF